MKIEIGKVYKDGEGRLIKVVYLQEQERECKYPVLGVIVQEEDFCSETIPYTVNGKYSITKPTIYDLVEEVETGSVQ